MEPLTIDALLRRLEALDPVRDEGIAFDADGTLWSGDVGEDFFGFVVENALLGPLAREATLELASSRGIDASGDVHAVAARIFDAYLRGTFDEREVCEWIGWLLAGHDLAGCRAEAGRSLDARDVRARARRETLEALAWAQAAGLRIFVVTASPAFVVEEATRRLGLEGLAVIGVEPAVGDGRVLARANRPIPYGADKVTRLEPHLGGARLLAAFGDSAFDIEMLARAAVGVAVSPKPSLRERASDRANLVELVSER